MTHGHGHDGHAHPHDHEHATDVEPDPAVNLEVDDGALSPLQLSRRNVLRAAGILGAGVASMGVLPTVSAAADETPRRPREGGFRWLAGDHHIHTQYSPDGQYRVIDHVRHAHAFGLDWMVITDHGSVQHARIGVEKVNPDIVAARDAVDEILVFQGLEWNIPAAEHGTVFVHPGPNEVSVLKAFENNYDGVVTATTASTAGNEAVAVSGLQSLSIAVTNRDVKDALMFANHPARKGLDSPHEIRAWRDAAPGIAVGMEGAPGHQAAGIATPTGPGAGRGFYDNSPTSSSFPAYPLASYRTYGGFDWMTSTVGGLWDSLLSEGKPWWITANSDSHQVWSDTSVRGAGSDFATNGFFNDPEHATAPQLGNGDFWPGYYSRTHVGAENFSYAAVMRGLREGRVWVDHGALIDALDVRLRAGDREVPLGGVLTARQGSPVQVVIRIRTASLPNWTQVVPKLAKVDVIRGDVTGEAADRDGFTAPGTKVVQTFDVSAQTGVIRLSYDLGPLSEGLYVRLRGSDGNRLAPGLGGAAVDPAGPQLDVLGDADPWKDLWFYSNPMWALPRR